MITLDDLYEHCETLPGVGDREYPFGDQPAVYKVGGKIFLFISEEATPPSISLKHDPEEGLVLRAEFPGHITPGYHLNKRHWSTILLAPAPQAPDPEEILDLVRRSYDLVVATLPKIHRPPSPD